MWTLVVVVVSAATSTATSPATLGLETNSLENFCGQIRECRADESEEHEEPSRSADSGSKPVMLMTASMMVVALRRSIRGRRAGLSGFITGFLGCRPSLFLPFGSSGSLLRLSLLRKQFLDSSCIPFAKRGRPYGREALRRRKCSYGCRLSGATFSSGRVFVCHVPSLPARGAIFSRLWKDLYWLSVGIS